MTENLILTAVWALTRRSLSSAWRKAEDPYKRWRSRNDDGSAAIAADAQINAWENELMAMEPTVRGMVGGL